MCFNQNCKIYGKVKPETDQVCQLCLENKERMKINRRLMKMEAEGAKTD